MLRTFMGLCREPKGFGECNSGYTVWECQKIKPYGLAMKT